MSDNNDDFDWNKLEEETVVTRGVRRTAVYLNPHNDIVIRQGRDWNEEDDPFLVLPTALDSSPMPMDPRAAPRWNSSSRMRSAR